MDDSPAAAFGIVPVFFALIFAVIYIIAMWKMYVKAGQPGWTAIVPIYNMYIMLKMVGRPGWWLLLFLVPLVNIVIMLLIAIDLAKAFGKSPTFGVIALWLFSAIGYLMLGFGDAKYIGPPNAPSQPVQPVQPQPVQPLPITQA